MKFTPKACAFLENVDQSITPKACASLNGMKLGGRVLTIVQAIYDALFLVINITLFLLSKKKAKNIKKRWG